MTKLLILAIFTQVLLSLIVMVIMGRRRFAAARAKEIKMQQFATMALDNAPEPVIAAGRNFINQFEIPVLFYVASLAALALNQVNLVLVAIAWVFVTTRIIHSIVHLTSNHLRTRFRVFLMGCVAVLVMWVWLLLSVWA